MPEPSVDVDVAAWVNRARPDPVAWRQRQAVEIALNAIAMTSPLRTKLYLKGGILMGLAYDSPRQTSDIDLTTAFEVGPDVDGEIRALIEHALPRAAARLGYADLMVQVHSLRRQPRVIFETANFPALKIKLAYAVRGTRQEDALQRGQAPGHIDIDISFNEPGPGLQVLTLTGGDALCAYSLHDLIAEKYRAMLQQVIRNRERRQDVYDLDRLISAHALGDDDKESILEAFREKCRAREIEPEKGALADPDIRRRSGANWASMALEIGELPDFGECYDRVRDFYENLPWPASP